MCCWPRSDRGGAFVEYVAVLVLVCAAVAVVVAFVLPQPVADGAARAVCVILQLDDCDGLSGSVEEAADAEYEPERCLLSRQTDIAGYQVEVVITFGTQFSFIQESFSTGETHVTLVDTEKLEASLGAGASLNVTKAFQLGAEINVGAGLSLPNGSTWVFSSPEEAAQFMDDLRTRQRIDFTRSVSPLAGWVAELVWGPDIPEPDIVREGWEGELGVDGSAGAGFGNERQKGGDGGHGGVEEWGINPKLQVEGAIGVTAALSQSTDRRDGSVSTTYSLGGTASIGADWVVGGWTPSGERSGTLTVTRDRAGQITQLTLTQVAASGDRVTVTTTELAVETAAERAMAEEWMGWLAYGRVLPLTWDALAPTELADDAGPFERWLFTEGRTSRMHYGSSDNIHEVSGSVKLGVSLGLGGTWGDESLHVTGAEYLGAPTDGVRSYIPYEACS